MDKVLIYPISISSKSALLVLNDGNRIHRPSGGFQDKLLDGQSTWMRFETPWRWYDVTLIARFMGPTWGPPGSCRSQVGPMLAPWTLLSGHSNGMQICKAFNHQNLGKQMRICFLQHLSQLFVSTSSSRRGMPTLFLNLFPHCGTWHSLWIPYAPLQYIYP